MVISRFGCRALFVLIIVVVAGSALTRVQAGEVEERVVQSAGIVIQQLEALPMQSIPASLLTNAEGIAIFPGVVKVGFLLAGRHGHGVLLVRQTDGTWSNPIFLQLTGGSIGWQAGVESTDVVLVMKTPRSVAAILNGSRFTLGGDASVAAGPVGREAAASTDLQLQAEIYSYSRSRGLFAGVALNGTVISIDNLADTNYYQAGGILASQILANNQLPAPPSAATLRNLVAQSGVRARVEYVNGVPQTTTRPAPIQAIAPLAPVPVNELRP